MTTSEADSSSFEGKSLFRLLTLIRETQCEVEVVKPLLDELEVMRLCRSFGMMSSVNPTDFDFDILDAREFDEDFTRFLQSDLLENKWQEKVRFKGLFGKQAQVLATLVDLKACSADILASLTELGEGVYCVKIAADSCSDSSRDDTAKFDVGLVVFSWLRDELFEPQQLRDTTTLVLRFLTVMTPDIICCTSTSDLEQLRAAMIDSGKQQDESLSSYSVFFAIEKQVDAVDGTKCVAQKVVDLKDMMEGCLRVCLLKGNYPALILTKTVESKLHVEQFQQNFSASARLKFAAWLKDVSRQYRVELSGTIMKSAALTETILREFDMWPATQIAAVSEARTKSDQEEYEMANGRLDEEIARQRSVVRRLSSALFQLDPGNMKGNSVEKEQTVMEYDAFRKWLKTKWKADRKLQLNLDIPIRLREVERAVFELYSHNQDDDVETVLGMCATSTKEQLLRAVAERRSAQVSSRSNTKSADIDLFRENVVGPLSKLQKQWLSAIENCLTMVKIAGLKLVTNEQKRKLESDASSAPIIQHQFEQLRQMLQSTHGLTMKLGVTMRKREITCKGTKEIQATDSMVEQVVKIEMGSCESRGTTIGLETLGQYFLKPGETHVAMFTIKTRSAVHVCTLLGRMLIKLVHFPPRNGARQVSQATDTIIHTLGKIASVCDYDCQSRTLAFLAGDSVGLYKCDENFKRMEVIKVIDLNVRSTLSDPPFTDVFLLKSTVYVTDSSGHSQGIDMHTDQINTAVSVENHPDQDARSRSRLMSFADNLAAGVVIVKPGVDAKFEAELQCVSLDDDHRHLPVLPLSVELLTQDLQVQCISGWLLAVDAVAQNLHLFSVDVSVESNSFRLRQFDDENEEDGSEPVKTESLRKQHWLYTFYHVFEKFPVLGLLEDGPQKPVTILATCSVGKNLGIALEDFHDFLSLLMSDLMALNKPLNRLNLTDGLGVRHASLAGIRMESMPLSVFFMTLVTFLPIQICRAEANTLTLLQDGMDEPRNEAEDGMDESSWGTAAIAESIRFGLLSPLLSAWQGRCVVVTSMGKQSTGKSYFLNHLTGSSFAIAGNRCTDGAWMTLRIMKDVLLVVLDFEGLGSFERTDQEDVFLAVLNASLSMFTIFRMEMRIDKEVDDLFTKFQKGVNLLKMTVVCSKGSYI
uniref:VLIG-type G domain-containing protein n=1 Tax=Peronospora matthiolae TaxID=2874970 RepID=A0AAV1UB45_9STRA